MNSEKVKITDYTSRKNKSFKENPIFETINNDITKKEKNPGEKAEHSKKKSKSNKDNPILETMSFGAKMDELNTGDKMSAKSKRSYKKRKSKKYNDEPEVDYNGSKRDEANPREKDPTFSGYFRDGKKRIDVVLVVQDDGDPEVEQIKINFLMSAIKSGLMLELEEGTMLRHRNLIFVKVHAPDDLLDQYGVYFNIKKYFKDSHIEFVKSKRTFLEKCFPFISIHREREWIKLVRQNYDINNYSTMDRSTIVHRILLHVRFGNEQNYFGLNRLLQKNVILDAYALHDGPYYLLNNQKTDKVNARQLLFYYWTGRHNWYKIQPMDLIYEYLGDRVSFYFAYFEYYNLFLFIAAMAGLLIAFLEIFDTTDSVINDETCNDETTYMCPACREFNTCPFKKLKDYCFMITVTNIIDNPFTFYFCLFIALWAITFISLWKRKEYYWKWIWELQENEIRHFIRPEFEINFNNVERSKMTGIYKNFESRRRRIVRIALTTFALIIGVFMVLLTNATLVIIRYWFVLAFSDNIHAYWGEYILLGVFGAFNVGVLVYLEYLCNVIAYILTDFENHRTQEYYENSLITKLYMFTFAFNFAVFIFFAYLKGTFYSYPSDPTRWYTLHGFGMMTCNPLGCLDEVWVMLMVTIFLKQILLRVFVYFTRMATDYNQVDSISENTPCWEREYTLKGINEHFFLQKIKDLVTQFGLVTLFVAAFPLAPFFALLMNIWALRYDARLILLGSRRPLLLRCSGLGAWREILLVLAYAVALTNALTLAMTTKTIQRFLYIHQNGNMNGFLNWTLSVFDVNDYLSETGPGSPAEAYGNYTGAKPEKYCLYPGFRKHPSDPDKYTLKQSYWNLKFYEVLFILVFEHFVIVLLLIMHYIIPSNPRDIQETLAIEHRLRNLYLNSHSQALSA